MIPELCFDVLSFLTLGFTNREIFTTSSTLHNEKGIREIRLPTPQLQGQLHIYRQKPKPNQNESPKYITLHPPHHNNRNSNDKSQPTTIPTSPTKPILPRNNHPINPNHNLLPTRQCIRDLTPCTSLPLVPANRMLIRARQRAIPDRFAIAVSLQQHITVR